MKEDAVATIDTSVLISLQRVELLAALSTLFRRVLVPAAVAVELARGPDRPTLEAIDRLAFFERCTEVDGAVLQLLLDTKKSRAGRDTGEAEAVAQGVQFSVRMVLVDDQLGREWARRFLLECHGTLWILDRLREAGMLAELRSHFALLVDGNRRQPIKIMNQILQRYGENPL